MISTISLDSNDLAVFEDGTTYYRDFCNSKIQSIQDALNNKKLTTEVVNELKKQRAFFMSEHEKCVKALRNLIRFRHYEQKYFPQGIEIPINGPISRERL